MTEQAERTLTQVFQDVFDDDSIVLRPDLTAADVVGWDSLTHIRLLLTIEREFGIKFTITEVGELKNVGELMEKIQSKTSGSTAKK
jgi:acyl carrier protein